MEENQQENKEKPLDNTRDKTAAERLTESMETREKVSMPQQKIEPKKGLNKYAMIGGVVVSIFIFGIVYRTYFVPEA